MALEFKKITQSDSGIAKTNPFAKESSDARLTNIDKPAEAKVAGNTGVQNKPISDAHGYKNNLFGFGFGAKNAEMLNDKGGSLAFAG